MHNPSGIILLPILLICLALTACQPVTDRSEVDLPQAIIARGWTDNSDDPNLPVLTVRYDPETWKTTDSFLYAPVLDLLDRSLPGCSLSSSGPHGGNPGWDVRPRESSLASESTKVLAVYDAASARLLFVHYEFTYPGVYFLVDVNLPDLTPEEQEECIRDAEDVLRTARELSQDI
jgi:hypothetical protein